MLSSRILSNIYKQRETNSFYHGFPQLIFSHIRSIFSTPPVHCSVTDTTEGSPETAGTAANSFTLLRFAEVLSNEKKWRTSGSTFDKKEAIVRYIGGLSPTGENIEASKKQEAAKQCNCTVDDVENVLAMFTWARGVHKTILNSLEEGKPIPKSMEELSKLTGSPPVDPAKSK